MTHPGPVYATTPALIDAMTRGYLECAAWADAPEGSAARFPAAQRAVARAVVAAFVAYVPQLVHAALEHCDAEHMGHDLWLTRTGAGTGFWDRDELAGPPPCVLTLRDRHGVPYLSSGRGETLGDALSAAAYGTAGAIAPWAYPSLAAYRGWLYFDGTADYVLRAPSEVNATEHWPGPFWATYRNGTMQRAEVAP